MIEGLKCGDPFHHIGRIRWRWVSAPGRGSGIVGDLASQRPDPGLSG